VRTIVSAPRDPPVIINCSQWINVSSDPGLMITWRIPHAEYFSGPKKTANILYRCPRGSGNVTLNDAYAHSTVLTAVEPSDSCHVWMKLCNEPGLCSSISNMCLSTPSIFKGNSSSGPTNSKNSVTKTVLMSVAGAAVGVILVIVIFMCYKRRRENGTPRTPLRNFMVMPPVMHGYDEIEEPRENNNCYDVITV